MKNQKKAFEESEQKRKKMQLKELVFTAAIMTVGILILKFLPMKIFGTSILFDASMHITIACFVLYVLYFFIDQNESWQIPYFIFCLIVLAIISMQRIILNAHSDIGLLAGLILSLLAIAIPRWNEIKYEIQF